MSFHQYVFKAKCAECLQYSWTDPNGGGVICQCGAMEIQGDAVVRGRTLPVNEAEFKKQVADDNSEAVKDVTIKQVTR